MSEDRRSPTQTLQGCTCLSHATQSATGIGQIRLFPAMTPCRICVHRLSAQTTLTKYRYFLLLISVKRRRVGSNSSSTELLVLCSVQLIRIVLRYMSSSNTFRLLLSATFVHDSHNHTVHCHSQIKVCMSLLFSCKFKERSFQRLRQ